MRASVKAIFAPQAYLSRLMTFQGCAGALIDLASSTSSLVIALRTY